jgi:hypothetical protein
MIRVRMIPADQIHSSSLSHSVRFDHIGRGDRKPVVWGIIPPVNKGQTIKDFTQTLSIAA